MKHHSVDARGERIMRQHQRSVLPERSAMLKQFTQRGVSRDRLSGQLRKRIVKWINRLRSDARQRARQLFDTPVRSAVNRNDRHAKRAGQLARVERYIAS